MVQKEVEIMDSAELLWGINYKPSYFFLNLCSPDPSPGVKTTLTPVRLHPNRATGHAIAFAENENFSLFVTPFLFLNST